MTFARLVLSLLLVLPMACAAQGRTGPATGVGYLTARDAAIDKIKKRDAAGGETTEAQARQERRMLAELGSTLGRLVGRVTVDGFLPTGKANLETLSSGDVGFGNLDALVFEARTGKGTLYVTTVGLLKAWLKDHRTWWAQEPLPQDAESALRTAAFYTQAVTPDAAMALYANLPVDRPANATLAIAALGATSQDLPQPLPEEIIVSVVRDDRVFIASAPLVKAFAAIPACDAIRADYANRQQTLSDAQAKRTTSGSADDASEDPLMRLENEGSAAALICFAAHAQSQSAFASARAQAQALVDLVSRR